MAGIVLIGLQARIGKRPGKLSARQLRLSLAWLGLAWLGLAWLGLAWLGKMVGRICGMSSVKLKFFEEGNGDKVLPLRICNSVVRIVADTTISSCRRMG